MSHWLAAGLHALDRAANAPAVTYLRSALEQLSLLAERGRARIELQIQMALAPAVSAIYGWGARDVETTCRRAIELATAVGDEEGMRRDWGLWTNYFMRGEMEPALDPALCRGYGGANGEHLPGAGGRTCPDIQPLFPRRVSRGSGCRTSRYGAVRSRKRSQALRAFQLSPSLALPTLLANVHWLLGDEPEALATLARAHEIADPCSVPRRYFIASACRHTFSSLRASGSNSDRSPPEQFAYPSRRGSPSGSTWPG